MKRFIRSSATRFESDQAKLAPADAQANPGRAGTLQEVAHAGIAPGRVEMQLAQGLRCNLQADGDGMKAVEHMAGHQCLPGRPKGTGTPSGGSE